MYVVRAVLYVRGVCTRFMHGRSRMAVDPRTPHNAGSERVGFLPTRQTSRAPSAKRRELVDRQVV